MCAHKSSHCLEENQGVCETALTTLLTVHLEGDKAICLQCCQHFPWSRSQLVCLETFWALSSPALGTIPGISEVHKVEAADSVWQRACPLMWSSGKQDTWLWCTATVAQAAMLSLPAVCETQPCKAKYGQGLEFKNDLLFMTLYKNYLLLESWKYAFFFQFSFWDRVVLGSPGWPLSQTPVCRGVPPLLAPGCFRCLHQTTSGYIIIATSLLRASGNPWAAVADVTTAF